MICFYTFVPFVNTLLEWSICLNIQLSGEYKCVSAEHDDLAWSVFLIEMTLQWHTEQIYFSMHLQILK